MQRPTVAAGHARRPPPELRPIQPPPPPRPSPYAARLAELGLPPTADPRTVKPGLHPSTLGGGRPAGVAGVAREAAAFDDALADSEKALADLDAQVKAAKAKQATAVDDGWGEDEAGFGEEDGAGDAAAAPFDENDDGQVDVGPRPPRAERRAPWNDDDDDDEEEEGWGVEGMERWPLGGRGGGGGGAVGAADASPASPSSSYELDLITGERVPPPPAPAADDPTGEAGGGAAPPPSSFAAAFRAAARALQARLVTGVRAELAAARDAQAALYSGSSTAALAAEGAVLTGLRAVGAGGAYGDALVALYAPAPPDAGADDGAPAAAAVDVAVPRASRAGGGLAAAAAPEAEPPPPARRAPLPFHRFGARDPILLARVAADGATPLGRPDGRGRGSAAVLVPGTVVDAAPDHLLVAVDPSAADAVDAAGPLARWRVDATVPDVTATRQLRALATLDAPWTDVASKAAAPYDDAAAVAAAAAAAKDDAPAALSPGWTPGELRVRSVLLGDPAGAATAATPPDWARDDGWRADVGAALAGDAGLNPSQREAVAAALASTLTLWQGPPGTGKTRTLVALLATMAKASRAVDPASPSARLRARSVPVLACGDTNAAADNLALGLAAQGVRVVRLGAASKATPGVAKVTLDALVARTASGKQAASLRARANTESARAKVAAAGGDATSAKAARAAADALRSAARDLVADASATVLAAAEVVVSTTAGTGDAGRLGTTRFRSVVVDEATQATEPSTLLPLLRGAEWAVLAGDPRQLPPTVASNEARAAGLDASLFERLQRGGLPVVLLDTQYRMHPAIAAFPSARFYGGRLKDGVPARDPPAGFPWPAPGVPVCLIEADDGAESRGGGAGASAGRGSFSNPREVALALRAADALLGGGGVDSVAILSPYAGQVRALRAALRAAPPDIRARVTAATVDSYQGREADAVILTTVRCNEAGSLGFVADARRMNVALTRGRSAAVVVGAPSTLGASPDWAAWLAWVTERGALLPGGALAPVAYEPVVAVDAAASWRGGFDAPPVPTWSAGDGAGGGPPLWSPTGGVGGGDDDGAVWSAGDGAAGAPPPLPVWSTGDDAGGASWVADEGDGAWAEGGVGEGEAW